MTRPHHQAHAALLARDLDRAFPHFVKETIDGVYSGVRRLTQDHRVEDITQETYLRAYRALRSYDEERIRQLNVAGWLWTIALNLCRNAARTSSRRPTTVGLDAVAESPTLLPSPEDEAISGAEAALWQRRLDRLSEPMRHAVVLRHVGGLTYAEISEALERPVGTVKADVHRGIERLRTSIQEERGGQ